MSPRTKHAPHMQMPDKRAPSRQVRPVRASRRNFLKIGVLGGTGLSLAGWLRLAAASPTARPTADSVLFVNLAGGPSHLDTLDVKPDGPSETRGEFQAIPTRLPGVAFCEHLPKLADIADRFTLVRGISHTAGSHPLGQSYLSTGNRPTPALVYPCHGSVVAKELAGPPDLPPFVAIPKTEWSAGYLGDAFAPLKTNSVPKPGQPFDVRGITLSQGLTVDQVNRRQQLLQKIDKTFRQAELESQLLEALDTFGRQAHEMITSSRARAAFDVQQEPAAIQQRFADDEFNQSLLLACRLIEFGTRFVTVTYDGWDTHTDNFSGHKRLLPPLDAGLPALLETLHDKGLLQRTLVVVMGEFGRTPKINVNAGRDHYPRVNCCLLAGGGIRPGQLIGGTDKGGESSDDATDLHPDDIAATLYHALGLDPRKEYHTSSGRPVMLVPQGRVLTEAFG